MVSGVVDKQAVIIVYSIIPRAIYFLKSEILSDMAKSLKILSCYAIYCDLSDKAEDKLYGYAITKFLAIVNVRLHMR